MNFLDCTTENGKRVLAELYEQLTGRKFKLPPKDGRGITCEVKIEDREQIANMMQEKPNYGIESASRHG